MHWRRVGGGRTGGGISVSRLQMLRSRGCSIIRHRVGGPGMRYCIMTCSSRRARARVAAWPWMAWRMKARSVLKFSAAKPCGLCSWPCPCPVLPCCISVFAFPFLPSSSSISRIFLSHVNSAAASAVGDGGDRERGSDFAAAVGVTT